ncbi:MAG TPA: EF-P lysine aminoacylase GenX, partial [Chromatiaceae bacterium]|nr:EF-P lysine aminoacylase GenX [Chromatiaceae bacterium]
MIDLAVRLRARAELLGQVRQFFAERRVLEVTTPVLAATAGTDPVIEPFVTTWRGDGHEGERTLYLQTSPEFHMKRLLAAGSGDIYQITPAFRQGEYGTRHSPEFSLLEWYRLGFGHHRLMDEVAGLVNLLLGQSLQFEKIAYRDLFLRHFGWDPLDVETEVLRATAEREGLDAVGLESRDQWLDLLMSLVIEP